MVPMTLTALLFTFFTFFLVPNGVTANSAKSVKSRLTTFQKNIQKCLNADVTVSDLQTVAQLFAALEVAYPLRTSEVIFREVTFTKKNEFQRLKYEKGKIQLFRVLPDQTVQLLNNDARQMGLTDESSFNQLLIGADVKSDWLTVKQMRLSQTLLTYTKQQGKFTAISFEKIGKSPRLDCTAKEFSDICLCRL